MLKLYYYKRTGVLIRATHFCLLCFLLSHGLLLTSEANLGHLVSCACCTIQPPGLHMWFLCGVPYIYGKNVHIFVCCVFSCRTACTSLLKLVWVIWRLVHVAQPKPRVYMWFLCGVANVYGKNVHIFVCCVFCCRTAYSFLLKLIWVLWFFVHAAQPKPPLCTWPWQKYLAAWMFDDFGLLQVCFNNGG